MNSTVLHLYYVNLLAIGVRGLCTPTVHSIQQFTVQFISTISWRLYNLYYLVYLRHLSLITCEAVIYDAKARHTDYHASLCGLLSYVTSQCRTASSTVGLLLFTIHRLFIALRCIASSYPRSSPFPSPPASARRSVTLPSYRGFTACF